MKKEAFYGPLAFFALWFMIYLSGFISPLFLPSPTNVLKKIFELLFAQIFWKDIGATIARTLISLFFSCILGVGLGIIIGYSKKISDSSELLVDFFRSLPVLVLFPLFIFFFGIGEFSKIATATFSGTLFIMVNSSYGVMNTNKTRLWAISSLVKISRLQIFRKIIFMESLPYVFVGIRTGIAIILIVVIVTEMFLATNNGIGATIYSAQLSFDTTLMYSYIFFAGMIGYSLNKALMILENNLFHWKGQ